jgi:hypothetical protein
MHFIAIAPIAAGILAAAISPAFATEVYKGRVANAAHDRITIERADHTTLIFELAVNASVTRNGARVKLEDLKTTDRVTVTTNNLMRAVLVDARSRGFIPAQTVQRVERPADRLGQFFGR